MGGYIGDQPPYQGKVVAIDRGSGAIGRVFNVLCANRRTVIDPTSCRSQEAAIWGRAGVVVQPGTHDQFVATSNGPFDGRTDWGTTLFALGSNVTFGGTHTTGCHQDFALKQQRFFLDDELVADSGEILADDLK